MKVRGNNKKIQLEIGNQLIPNTHASTIFSSFFFSFFKCDSDSHSERNLSPSPHYPTGLTCHSLGCKCVLSFKSCEGQPNLPSLSLGSIIRTCAFNNELNGLPLFFFFFFFIPFPHNSISLLSSPLSLSHCLWQLGGSSVWLQLQSSSRSSSHIPAFKWNKQDGWLLTEGHQPWAQCVHACVFVCIYFKKNFLWL